METMWIVLLILLVVVALLAYTGYLSELIKKLGGAFATYTKGDRKGERVMKGDTVKDNYGKYAKVQSDQLNVGVMLYVKTDNGLQERWNINQVELVARTTEQSPEVITKATETIVTYNPSPIPEATPVKSISTGRKGTVGQNLADGKVRVMWKDGIKDAELTNQSDLKAISNDEYYQN